MGLQGTKGKGSIISERKFYNVAFYSITGTAFWGLVGGCSEVSKTAFK